MGRAVSPDNILLGDGPPQGGLYGYAAPLQFREERRESVPVHVWKKVDKRGTLTGKVTFEGSPRAGVFVSVQDGMSTHSGPDGRYVLANVPLGSYTINARAEGVPMLRASVPVTLEAGETVCDIPLVGPDERFRKVVVQGNLHIVDDEHGRDEVVDRPFYREIYVGPFQKPPGEYVEERMGGEIRVELPFSVELQPDNSVQLGWQMRFYEGTREDTHDLEMSGAHSTHVPPGAQQGWTQTLADGSGSVRLDVTITNEVNPT